jgi:hypothetical protein
MMKTTPLPPPQVRKTQLQNPKTGPGGGMDRERNKQLKENVPTLEKLGGFDFKESVSERHNKHGKTKDFKWKVPEPNHDLYV